MPKPAPQHPETQVLPDAALEKRTRRRFSTEFKLRMIARADACQYGELGELLRVDGLYSGQLQQWCKDLTVTRPLSQPGFASPRAYSAFV